MPRITLPLLSRLYQAFHQPLVSSRRSLTTNTLLQAIYLLHKVHHDRDEAGMQRNTTSKTASCKLAPSDHIKHAHEPGSYSIQAYFANATLKQSAAKQQLAPGNTVNMRSPTVLQKPPNKNNITVDKEIHLQQEKFDSDCSISLDTTKNTRKARQASTLLETCRGV